MIVAWEEGDKKKRNPRDITSIESKQFKLNALECDNKP